MFYCKQVSFSPMDTSLACVSGNSIFQFYRVTEGDLRPMTVPRVKDHNFLSHAWLKQPEDHLVLGTETGQLLLFRSGDFLCCMVGAPGGNTKITVIISYSQVQRHKALRSVETIEYTLAVLVVIINI